MSIVVETSRVRSISDIVVTALVETAFLALSNLIPGHIPDVSLLIHLDGTPYFKCRGGCLIL